MTCLNEATIAAPHGIFSRMIETDRTLIDAELYEAKQRTLEIAEFINRLNKRKAVHVSTNLLDGYGIEFVLEQ